MGYYIDQQETEFGISKENFGACLEALKEKAKRDRDFSWVNNAVVRGADTLVQALQEWGWQLNLDADGNGNSIDFMRDKLGDEEVLFETIAPFVAAGSFIEVTGEEGARWRWHFDGKECVELYPTITWE
jgi:hypothetical protein